MTPTFRGFYALPLDAAAVRAALGVQAQLRRFASASRLRVRWAAEHQLHVTLKFLGSAVPVADAAQLEAITHEAAQAAAPIATTLDEVAVFGPPTRARVLHLAVADPDGVVARIAARLDHELQRLGYVREVRPFRPHVTLGRFRRPTNAIPLLEAARLGPIPLRLDRLVLYASTLTQEGSIYRVVAESALQG